MAWSAAVGEEETSMSLCLNNETAWKKEEKVKILKHTDNETLCVCILVYVVRVCVCEGVCRCVCVCERER